MAVISHSLAYFLLRRENWGNILPKAHFQGKLAFKLIMHVIFSLYECKIATLLTLVGTKTCMYSILSVTHKNGMHEWNNIIIEHFNPMSDRYQVKDGWKKPMTVFMSHRRGFFVWKHSVHSTMYRSHWNRGRVRQFLNKGPALAWV